MQSENENEHKNTVHDKVKIPRCVKRQTELKGTESEKDIESVNNGHVQPFMFIGVIFRSSSIGHVCRCDLFLVIF